MATRLGNDTVIIREYPMVVDSRDNSRYRDYSATPTEFTIKNCSVQPFLLTDKLKIEKSVEREFTEDTWRVWATLRPGQNIEHYHRAVFQGVEYEVRGILGRWRDFSGKEHHVNFMIRRRVG